MPMPGSSTVVLLLPVILLVVAQEPSRPLALPAWVQSATCRIGAAEAVVQTGGSLIVPCARSDEVLSCDFVGGEPLDVPIRQLCEQSPPVLHEAVTVPIGPRRDDITVEWLDWAVGSSPRRIASRKIAAGSRSLVPVASVAGRLIRIVSAEAGPVTLPARAWIAGAGRLPRTGRGHGELVARVARARVVPSTYELRGGGSTALQLSPDADGFWVARGLPAGSYRVAAKYAGGPWEPVRDVQIDAADTRRLDLPPHDVGAVQLIAGSDICQLTSRIIVRRRVDGGFNPMFTWSIPHRSECGRMMAGLQPGTYEVALHADNGSFDITRDIVIETQQVAAADFDSAVARVSGLVRVGGELIRGGASVVFFETESRSDLPRGYVGQVLTGGQYGAILPKPGDYKMRFRSGSLFALGAERDVAVQAGFNSVDWDIDGAALRVDIRNWDRSSPVYVVFDLVETPATVSATGDETKVTPGDELPLTILGVAPGRYELRARQQRRGGDYLSSRSVRVDMTTSGTHEVVLELEDYSVTLLVRGPDGRAVAGASVESVDRGLIRESEPGRFVVRADRATAGSHLIVRAPGFMPTCRVAPASGSTVELSLGVGTPTEVRFLGVPGIVHPPGYLLWTGAECPVPLADFVFQPLPADPGGKFSRLLFQHFPPAAGVVYLGRRSGPPRPLSVRDGVVEIVLTGR